MCVLLPMRKLVHINKPQTNHSRLQAELCPIWSCEIAQNSSEFGGHAVQELAGGRIRELLEFLDAVNANQVHCPHSLQISFQPMSSVFKDSSDSRNSKYKKDG